MSVYSDFTLSLIENGTLIVAMQPSMNISGWSLQYVQNHRFGGEVVNSGIGQGFTGTQITKWAASGFNNVSGINVTNGPTGIFAVTLNPGDVSGLSAGNQAYFTARIDSGNVTILSEGFRLAMDQ